MKIIEEIAWKTLVGLWVVVFLALGFGWLYILGRCLIGAFDIRSFEADTPFHVLKAIGHGMCVSVGFCAIGFIVGEVATRLGFCRHN